MKRLSLPKLKKPSLSGIGETIARWDTKKLAIQFVVFGVVIALISSVFWYKEIYMDEERRFWAAINNSLSTDSVVRTLTNGGTGNQVVQSNRFYFDDQKLTESKVTFTNRSATVDTTVVTEGINTLDSQYSRYVEFDTNDTRADGSVPNLDDLVGQWSGETTTDPEDLEQTRLSYVSELVTLVIFGNYSASDRADLIAALQDNQAYTVNFNNVVEDNIDGEDVLIYPVFISLRAYAEQLQRGFELAGYGSFPPLDPANYQEGAQLNAQFAVRKRDNAIVGINFGDRSESYSNHGVQKRVEIPEPNFTPLELEVLVEEEIQG